MEKQPHQSFDEVRAILDRIQVMNWKFRLMTKGSDADQGYLLQVTFLAPDSDEPDSSPILQHCRKWYVSPWSTTTEIVRTAYKAICVAMEHEVDEGFRYRGKRIFSPHYDVDKLASGELDGARADKRRGGPAVGKRK